LSDVAFPQGLFDFSLAGCSSGSTVTVSIAYPSALPAATQYWKYGVVAGTVAAHWYTIPSTIAGNTITFSITDGGVGDNDLTANGSIVDPGGPGIATPVVYDPVVNYPVINYPVVVSYNVHYGAEAHGSLSGSVDQTINQGADASSVTAVPESGYHFVSWSDGVTTASRADKNINAAINVSARFAINTYTLNYSAGANGTLTGNLAQTVNYAGSGESVVAVAQAGFFFDRWSDGVTTASRTDNKVAGNIAVSARFVGFCNTDKRFDSERMIPDYADLSCKLQSLADVAQPGLTKALDLNDEVLVKFDKTVWQQIQALLLAKLPGSAVQLTATGQLWVSVEQRVYTLIPVRVLKAAANDSAGISISQDGQVKMVTINQRMIYFSATVADMNSLQTAFNNFGIRLEDTQHAFGHWVVPLLNANIVKTVTPAYYSARPELFSEPVVASNATNNKAPGEMLGHAPGLLLLPYLEQDIKNIFSAYLIYEDGNKKRMQQALPPMPADWAGLRQVLQAQGFTEVTLQSDGVMRGQKEGKTYRGIMDYSVESGASTGEQVRFEASVGDLNGDGVADVKVIYPNGQTQNLIRLP
jgi:hypothetical protein